MIRLLQKLYREYYLLLLVLLVLVSYGQILGMYVWQDDNGLFFKLAHIDEKAGYLGAGPFGSGAYKYIHTPYIPVYQLFGFNTVAFFSFTLAIYFITTVLVYKVFSSILGKDAGKIGGLLYASGYIASDGFIRLFNSVITSVSIILISLMFLFYCKFFKNKQSFSTGRNLKWYLLSLLFFFLAIEFAVGRTHYLIGVVIFFELIFFAFKKPLKSVFYSFLRTTPFLLIFYQYYILNGDHRSGQVKNLLLDLSRGEFYQLYSFLTSFLNVVIPDWATRFILNLNINPNLFSWLTVLGGWIAVFLLLRSHAFNKILIICFSVIIFTWKIIVNDLFSTQVLNLSSGQILLVYLGGLLLILTPVIFIALQQYKRMYLFLIFWVMINIGAYAAYNPTVSYESVNRYLAHSFFAWIGVLLVFYIATKNLWRKVVLSLIIFWGLGNLMNSVVYQNHILKERSNPPRNFYNQLKVYLPEVKKGDIFYFDVSNKDLKYFDDAFSVASMPETTAIAWRYGVDRYDINRFTDFKEFAKFISLKNIKPEQIHAFWYSNQNLVDTSDFVRKQLQGPNTKFPISFEQQEDIISFKDIVSSTLPIELSLEIEASPLGVSDLNYPHQEPNISSNQIHHDPSLKQLTVNYFKTKKEILDKSIFSSTSEWQDRVLENVYDQNPDTVWQADRVLWQKGQEALTLDVGTPQQINRFVWINGFANNGPTKYKLEVSLSGDDWKVVKEINQVKRIDTKDPQVIEFSPQSARFFRMTIYETLGGDSPTIAEAWVVSAEFGSLNIQEAENFIKNPFSYIESFEDYEETLQLLGSQGSVLISWLTDKRNDWQTDPSKKIDLYFDGKIRTVKIEIPAGGTKLEKLKLSSQIPGEITVRRMYGRNVIK